MQQQNVAVYHRDVPETVSEPGPAAEVVYAEYLSLETESASQVGHVNCRGAEERADLDDRPWLHFPYEVLKYGAFGPPAFDALGTEAASHVRWWEVVERGGGVEEPVQDCLADQVGLDRAVCAVSGDSEVVELVGELDERRN